MAGRVSRYWLTIYVGSHHLVPDSGNLISLQEIVATSVKGSVGESDPHEYVDIKGVHEIVRENHAIQIQIGKQDR